MKKYNDILKKTYGLLLLKGWDGVSVSDIQQASETARGLLYHYFPSKEVLFEETLLENVWKKFPLERAPLKEKDIGDVIVWLTRYYAGIAEDLQSLNLSGVSLQKFEILLCQSAFFQENLSVLYKKAEETKKSIWKMAVLNSFAKGELRSGLNLESVARHFTYLVAGVVKGEEKSMGETLYALEKALQEFREIIKRP